MSARMRSRRGRSGARRCDVAGRTANQSALPILQRDFRFRQTRDLPRLTATAIPVDVGVAERDEAQSEIATLVALRVEADRHDRRDLGAAGQLLHLARQPLLKLVRSAAADSDAPQPDSAWY